MLVIEVDLARPENLAPEHGAVAGVIAEGEIVMSDQQCMTLFVANVARLVRFPLNQMVKSQFSAIIVLLETTPEPVHQDLARAGVIAVNGGVKGAVIVPMRVVLEASDQVRAVIQSQPLKSQLIEAHLDLARASGLVGEQWV